MKIEDSVPIFQISIVSKLCGVPMRMLREYEKQGLIHPQKLNGRRIFTPTEVGFIKDLHFYLSEKNMTIPGLKEFYFRAGCWEIKRCNQKQCPAYGNVRRECWDITSHHKKCDSTMCPLCPIFLIKMSHRGDKADKPIGPSVYPKTIS